MSEGLSTEESNAALGTARRMLQEAGIHTYGEAQSQDTAQIDLPRNAETTCGVVVNSGTERLYVVPLYDLADFQDEISFFYGSSNQKQRRPCRWAVCDLDGDKLNYPQGRVLGTFTLGNENTRGEVFRTGSVICAIHAERDRSTGVSSIIIWNFGSKIRIEAVSEVDACGISTY